MRKHICASHPSVSTHMGFSTTRSVQSRRFFLAKAMLGLPCPLAELPCQAMSQKYLPIERGWQFPPEGLDF